MPTALTSARQAQLITHGALIFIGGLIAGLALTFSIIGHIEVWPIPGQIDLQPPGDSRAWLRSHLGLIMNAIGIWVFMSLGARLPLSNSQQKLYVLCVLATAWFNSAGFIIGTLFGVHGLAFGGPLANSATYVCFLIAVVTVFIQISLVLIGARAMRSQA